MSDKLRQLEHQLGYQFRQRDLLQRALTHRSRGADHNERLEFLGDSILNYIVAEALFERFDSAREGELSLLRTNLVSGAALAELARELELGEYLRLGAGERNSGGQQRASILADTLESIVAAILLDGGIAACRERVLAWFAERLQRLSSQQVSKDPKTRLQEYVQGCGQQLPVYQLIEVTGVAHRRQFTVSCSIDAIAGVVAASGGSRRQAEQAAARIMLEQLHV